MSGRDGARPCPAIGVDFAGFLDDGDPDADRLARLEANLLGGLEWLRNRQDVLFYVGIGDPAVRRRVTERAVDLGATTGPALIHPTSVVGSDVKVGPGSVLAPGAVVTTNVRLGHHVHLGSNVVVGHDSRLEAFVSVYPGATISGNCQIEAGVTIGTNAAVRQGTRVGLGATVGAGAAVVKDVEAGSMVIGVPARPR